MTKEEMNRLVATKIKEIKALNPDLNAVLLALHDENGSVVCAAGDDVDGLASAFLAIASSVAIPFVKHCDKDHAAKVNEKDRKSVV